MKRKIAFILVSLIVFSTASALADYSAILKKNAKIYSDEKMKNSLGTIPKYISVVVKSVKSGRAKINFR